MAGAALKRLIAIAGPSVIDGLDRFAGALGGRVNSIVPRRRAAASIVGGVRRLRAGVRRRRALAGIRRPAGRASTRRRGGHRLRRAGGCGVARRGRSRSSYTATTWSSARDRLEHFTAAVHVDEGLDQLHHVFAIPATTAASAAVGIGLEGDMPAIGEASMTMNPALCRVCAYFEPGFPRPNDHPHAAALRRSASAASGLAAAPSAGAAAPSAATSRLGRDLHFLDHRRQHRDHRFVGVDHDLGAARRWRRSERCSASWMPSATHRLR